SLCKNPKGLLLCFSSTTHHEQQKLFQKKISVSVDLKVDPSLQIDIPDALSEREKVTFTVHTKTTLPTCQSPAFSVTRQHEDLCAYMTLLLKLQNMLGSLSRQRRPSDFDGPREKIEFAKMKQELEEVDDFFEQEKTFLINCYNRIKDSCAKADRMTRPHKSVADEDIHTAACLHSLALEEPAVIKKYLLKVAE
ncbi:hypothetical protein FD755_025660, partial [Muntiacus reevesi]